MRSVGHPALDYVSHCPFFPGQERAVLVRQVSCLRVFPYAVFQLLNSDTKNRRESTYMKTVHELLYLRCFGLYYGFYWPCMRTVGGNVKSGWESVTNQVLYLAVFQMWALSVTLYKHLGISSIWLLGILFLLWPLCCSLLLSFSWVFYFQKGRGSWAGGTGKEDRVEEWASLGSLSISPSLSGFMRQGVRKRLTLMADLIF